MTDERKDQLSAEADGMIEGRNAVIEALRTQTNIDKIYIQRGETDKPPRPGRRASLWWRPTGASWTV